MNKTVAAIARSVLAGTLVIAFSWNPLQACTSFSVPHSITQVTAKSFDWMKSHGMAVVNKKNVKKTAVTLNPFDKPVQWVSKYTNLTFTQLGREFPYGGINENGLVVEILWLDASQYAQQDDKPVINEVQWIQYMLDRAANVKEAVALARAVRVAPFYAQVHYFLCDTTGECAVFEYIKGKLVISPALQNVASTITNDPYRESVDFLKKHKGFGGDMPIPDDDSSLSRFVRATALGRGYDPAISPVSFAFNVLSRVRNSQEIKTQWNLVYVNSAKQVFFKTSRSSEVKSINLSRFDGSCKSPVKVFNMNADGGGDVTSKFVDYTEKINLSVARQNDFLPQEFIALIAGYPAKGTSCQQRPNRFLRMTRR